MTIAATVCEICGGLRDDANELERLMESTVGGQKIDVCWGCWADLLPARPKGTVTSDADAPAWSHIKRRPPPPEPCRATST